MTLTGLPRRVIREIVQLVFAVLITVLFGAPLVFVALNAGMDVPQAAEMRMALPESPQYLANLGEVIAARDGAVLRAFWNSSVITVSSIVILIVVGAMSGMVLQRRRGKAVTPIMFLVLAGLMVPPAVVPTIKLLQTLGIFKTLYSMVLIEVAINLPVTIVLYRAYMVSIPQEMDESALIEGASPWQLYWRIILPLVKPVTATVIVLSAVFIFNDFVHPLYFLPGAENVTVQLTLYNFMSRYATQWNLLFSNVLLISLPPLVAFIVFNKRIVAGVVAGAVKG